jgi:hypothetical protein
MQDSGMKSPPIVVGVAFSVGDGLGYVRDGFRTIVDHVAAVSMAAGDIFVYTVIALDEFCKTAFANFGVCLGCVDEIQRHDLPHRSITVGTALQRFVVDGLLHLDDLAPVTRAVQMFVLVYRHSIPPGNGKNMARRRGAPYKHFAAGKQALFYTKGRSGATK